MVQTPSDASVITLDEMVRASRLFPTVAPFTIRRVFIRLKIFNASEYTTAEVRQALPALTNELQEVLSPSEFVEAKQALELLIARSSQRD